MKKPVILALDNPALFERAMQLESTGTIACSPNQLIYLNLDDAWIHALFPFLPHEEVKKPNYFGIEGIGAHISVIYPEENTTICQEALYSTHHFKIKSMVKATLGLKHYYVLMLRAPSLVQLRKAAGLPARLNFKGYAINLHITIAVGADHQSTLFK